MHGAPCHNRYLSEVQVENRNFLLAKACAHAGIKAIGVKTTVITSAIFAVRRPLQSEEEEEEQMEGLVVFCQEV